jgi:uncharacterized protein YbjT (DUF2867 family)
MADTPTGQTLDNGRTLSSRTALILGATGRIGGETAAALLRQARVSWRSFATARAGRVAAKVATP